MIFQLPLTVTAGYLAYDAVYYCARTPKVPYFRSPYLNQLPIPVAARSNAWVWGRSFVGIASSNPVGSMDVCTRVVTLIVATIYLQLIQNRYMFRSFTVLQCSHQNCVQPVASDVEVVGYL